MPHNVPVAFPEEDLLEIGSYHHTFKVPVKRTFEMAMFKKLVARHKARSLCYRCKRFTPETPEKNCSIARLLFALCVQCEIVAPVAECKTGLFEARETPHPWIGT